MGKALERYDKKEYYGFISQGKVREAVAYLERFPSKRRLVKKYMRVFRDGKTVTRCRNAVIHKMDAAFQAYYRQIFWQGESSGDAWKKLCLRFADMFEIPVPALDTLQQLDEFWYGVIEDRLEKAVEGEGYQYLGNDTQGYLGPYIWKKTVPTTYRVKLPHAVTRYTVNTLTGFVSRSWMAFLSFDKIGTGGWAAKDGTLCCIKKLYAGGILNTKFRVRFLKHEAQHVEDRKQFPGISSMHLEYRAKLVELIYAVSFKTFQYILAEACADNPSNTHSCAAYLIVKNLSEKIFGRAYVGDAMQWEAKLPRIRKVALTLLDEYPYGT